MIGNVFFIFATVPVIYGSQPMKFSPTRPISFDSYYKGPWKKSCIDSFIHFGKNICFQFIPFAFYSLLLSQFTRLKGLVHILHGALSTHFSCDVSFTSLVHQTLFTNTFALWLDSEFIHFSVVLPYSRFDFIICSL